MQKLRQQELENEKATIQNRQLEVELAASKLALAERMLATFDRDHSMSDRRRQRLLHQFVTGIDQMSKTSIEFKAVSGSSGDDNALTDNERATLERPNKDLQPSAAVAIVRRRGCNLTLAGSNHTWRVLRKQAESHREPDGSTEWVRTGSSSFPAIEANRFMCTSSVS
jgi:hypothetical protein